MLKVATTGEVKYSALTLQLAACIAVLLVPFLYNDSDIAFASDRFLGLVAGLLFFLILQQFEFSEQERFNLLVIVIASVLVEAAIGWAQILSANFGFDLAPYNNHSPAGVFQQVNVMASFLATGLVLSGYLVTRLSLAEKKWQAAAFATFLYLTPITTIHLLNFLGSRTGLLGALVGLLCIAPLLFGEWRKRPVRVWFASLLVGFLFSFGLENSGNTQLEGSTKEVATFASLRQIHMPQTIDMILDNPVTGYGYGKFERSFVEYTADAYAAGKITIPGVGGLDHPHNELMFWAAEGGIVGLLGLLLAAWFVWTRVRKLAVRHRIAIIGVFFPITLHTQLEFPFYTSLLHWIIFILLIYWVDSLVSPVRRIKSEQQLIFGTIGVVGPMVGLAFMVSTLQSGYLLAKYEFGIEEDVRIFDRMSNPVVWIDRLLLAINFRLVLNGVAFRDGALAEPFIEWAPGFLEKYPRPMHFRYLIMAYQVAGDLESANSTLARARYLFPGEVFDLVDLEMLSRIRVLRRPI